MGGTTKPYLTGIAALAAMLLASTAIASTSVIAAPAIRTTDTNRVPQCATPERLMAYIRDRNPGLDPRYREIANWYRHWGNTWRVRWDYAFYQMILETNALKYRRGDGRRGDVHEKQNNFAGIGATGGGVPGDRFATIQSGVHAQIQHLVAYSGERLAEPIAPRTQLRQDDIIEQSRRLRRPVTFGDLARRWAVDRAYARSIDAVADQFHTKYCDPSADAKDAAQAKPSLAPAPAPRLATRARPRRTLSGFAAPSGLGGPMPVAVANLEKTEPWSSAQAQPEGNAAQPDAATAPTAPAPVQPARKILPVRTIWSRDGDIPPAAAAPSGSTPPNEPARNAQAQTPAVSRSATPPAGQAAQEDTAAPEASANTTGETPTLPQFKIGPGTMQGAAPSKLGGPIATDLAMPESRPVTSEVPVTSEIPVTADQDVEPSDVTTGPNARVSFKQVIGTPPTDQASAPCRVMAASFGGTKTLLVRTNATGETRYTALTVLDGFEKSMFDTYAKTSAPGAEVVGEYATREEALADARTNCPAG